MTSAEIFRIYHDAPTVKDAMAQLGVKGTQQFYRLLRKHGIKPGRRAKHSPLTDEACRALMRLKYKTTAKKAAEMFGCSPSTVNGVWNYERRTSATRGV